MHICENPKCNNIHNGSYGSGRFCSEKCRRQYCGLQGSQALKKFDRKITKGKPQNHDKSRAPYGTWKCTKCNLIFETRSKLFEHNRENHPVPKGQAWNKGLTKETDERVAIGAKKVSESLKQTIADGYVNPTWSGEYWTKDKRKLLSDKKTKFYTDNPEKHPNRLVSKNRNKMTYPEQITYDWLISNNIEFECQKMFIFDNKKRFADFFIKSLNLIIEVDGEYWHKNTEYDNEKDNIAFQHGINTLRIKAKNNIVEQLENYFKFS